MLRSLRNRVSSFLINIASDAPSIAAITLFIVAVLQWAAILDAIVRAGR